MQRFEIQTHSRTEFYNITRDVMEALTQLGIRDGIITVFVPHTTAGVTINENADPSVVGDMAAILDRTVPWTAGYRHAEGNSAAHMKASLMGASAQVIVDNGHLQLGTWQGIYYCEFDGPRRRCVWVSGVASPA
jgi:secondary thiamine-phosphate synthase enzyme